VKIQSCGVKGCGTYLSKDVAHTFQGMWHIHVEGCGTRMPKNIAHTCQRTWYINIKECSTHI